MQQNVPPLRGYYDPRGDQPPPLTERQQTQLDLANLEGAYSGWEAGRRWGGIAAGRRASIAWRPCSLQERFR